MTKEDLPDREIVAGCSHCPTCGGNLEMTGSEDDVAVTRENYKCSACGLPWQATYQKGHEEFLLSICPLDIEQSSEGDFIPQSTDRGEGGEKELT